MMHPITRIVLSLMFLSIAGLRAQSEITSVVQIPLYHPADGATNKWGIYLSIWGGTAPGLFELDTGGTGFYAAYATNGASPWWGTNYSVINNNATNLYDSGLYYTGNVVSSAVSFWANSNAASATISSPTNVLVGQSTTISSNNITLWTESQASNAPPPINNGAFYGDFGLSLNSASNALVNIIAQMTFTNGILPGFLINAPLSGTNGYLQIGLLPSQTNAAGFNYFAMNTQTTTNGASVGSFNNNTNITYKSEQLFNATMTLSNGSTAYATNIGITPDTGATPKLHNTTNDPNFPTALTNANGLADGISFTLSATNNAGILTNITSFTTTNSSDYASNLASVDVQNAGSLYTNYYYNSGLYLFNQHQVIYDLQNSSIGLGPTPNAVPEPSEVWLLVSAAGVFLLLRSIESRRA